MSNFIVLYDACVLYSAPLRDLLMRLALTDLFRAKWTNEIHDEWVRNVLANRNDLIAAMLGRTRDLMNVISSIKIDIKNVHALCNLIGRKLGLMEDSIHTEKHRGYHYNHAYFYHWNAMQGFHLSMRLAHAVNAMSEFTKKLKKWIKEQGCAAILNLIKETIFNPWLSQEWYEQQHTKPIRLTLQLE